ncbi:hypothetical protein [Longimicrobium sp.]|uniref:hypothetical protein n=1 Tax=Longimicrobium sp. TaxID=2029185 RepID=UPI002E2F4CE3|nr:hypothetical protein [Longimicrobium sp.]HEX6039641.1 hypothetical protein [Longimicrobium sp.]
MSQQDLELMLWALSHGWKVSVFSAPTAGALWKDPARRRFLVYTPGAAPDLPGLSDEVRARIQEARAAAGAPLAA